ncbi:MAG: hypothetical protein KZQ84_00580 [Candidatus Thiodiazotropha sp. (ex Lucinoma borealis)]|nr:hypothetical protein [Candidatus Thiodiazotropha sp. (ex Lucinoma borealis)]
MQQYITREGTGQDLRFACELCEEQVQKQRYTEPHKHLRPKGERRAYRVAITGGYEEQDYICESCGAEFTYSNDKNDYGWNIHRKKE